MALANTIASKPSFIQWNHLKFLIMDAPNESNISVYIKECKRYNVSDIVRTCEVTYSRSEVEAAGIVFHEMQFTDGESPPREIINSWLLLVHEKFGLKNHPKIGDNCIAVHCVAGLGRAPVLVAIALIDAGLDALNAVELIRSSRRGAINVRQLGYLEQFYRQKQSQNSCTFCAIS